MIAVLVAILFVLIAPARSHSQPNWSIDLYPDAQMSGCSVSYTQNTFMEVHAFHTGDPATGVHFAVYIPPCMTGATYLGDSLNPYLNGGSMGSPRGLIVAYLACLTSPIHIGRAFYLVTDPTVACCDFVVSAPTDLSDGPLEGADCTRPVPKAWPASAGKKLRVNPNASCPCDLPVSTQETTWGKVKALYR